MKMLTLKLYVVSACAFSLTIFTEGRTFANQTLPVCEGFEDKRLIFRWWWQLVWLLYVRPPVQGEQQMVEAEDADVPERGLQAPAHRADTWHGDRRVLLHCAWHWRGTCELCCLNGKPRIVSKDGLEWHLDHILAHKILDENSNKFLCANLVFTR